MGETVCGGKSPGERVGDDGGKVIIMLCEVKKDAFGV